MSGWTPEDDDYVTFMLRCESCGAEYGSSGIDCPACGSANVSYASDDARRADEFNNRPRYPR